MTVTAERTALLPDPSVIAAVRSHRPYGRRPVWALPGLAALLAATSLLYLWGLGESGWANAYYSAAAQAGAQNWTAFFFGSLDPGNAITVDKTPASLWVASLSVRVFGLSPWSVLVPQALAGVATVGVLYAAVRRWYGEAAGLLAGAVLAVTPVAVLMFRYNNPDALLTLLLVLGAFATVRAVETAATRWVVLVGVLVGLGFLAKMLQALLVVPAFAIVYLVAAPAPLRRRIGQLLAGGVALLASGGWWVAAVELIPADRRPFVGGSQTNSALELTLGYNGLGRLTGEEAGAIGSWWGYTGLDRLFTAEFANGISWLLPAAIGLLAAGLRLAGRAPRTDRLRAGFLLWGGWLLVTWLTFSFMAGIFHHYYNVALAPAIAALVGMGVTVLWRHRGPAAMLVLATAIAVTVGWAALMPTPTPHVVPWLPAAAAIVGCGAAIALAVATAVAPPASRRGRGQAAWRGPEALRRYALVAGLAAALAGPVAVSAATAATPHEGAIPKVGPAEDVSRGPLWGAGGGLVEATRPTEEVVAALRADADRFTWVAATVGANNAAGYQLASGEPVLALGGFNGSDPFPSLAQFQQLVAEGRIHYFLDGWRFRSVGGSREAHEIADWVIRSYRRTTVGGVGFFDLTAPPRRTTP